MCFYNDMDDYAKMRLQLIFPFYIPHLYCYIAYHKLQVDTVLEYRGSLYTEHYQFLLHYTYCPILR